MMLTRRHLLIHGGLFGMLGVAAACSSAAPATAPTATSALAAKPAAPPSPPAAVASVASSPSTSPTAVSSPVAKPSAAAQPSPAAAAGGPRTLVKGAWVAQTANQMIVPLALDAGYFAQNGIDFQLTFIQGSATAMAAVLSKDLDTTSVAGSAIVGARAAGQDVVMVAGFVNIAIFRVMAMDPAIQSLDDLKGKTVAAGQGTADYYAWQTVIQRQNWSPSDLQFQFIEGTPAQIAQLQNGRVAAIILSPPNNVAAEKVGAHQIFDTASYNEPEQNVGIAMTRAYLDANRPTATNVVKACIEAIARWKKDPATSKATIAKYLNTTDQDYIDVGYSAYVDVFPQAPYPSVPGFAHVIQEVSAQNAKAKDVQPEQCIDDSIVRELENSGFIKQLYG